MNILSPVTAWRALPRTVWLLVLARTVNRLGAFTLPFLSVTLVTSWGASVVDAGYLLAAFGVATIPSRLVGGWLADRWGTRAAIVTGLLATAGAQLALAAAPSLGFAAVAVVALGLAFEIYEPFAAMAIGYLLLGAGLVSVGLVHDLVPLAAATVLWSLGDLVLIGRATAVVAGIAPVGARGGYLATYGLGWGVAAIVGPLVGTRLLAAGGPVLLWSVLGVVCLGLAVAQPVVRREVSGRTPPANAVRPAPRPARR